MIGQKAIRAGLQKHCDAAAIALAAGCGIHCVLTPLLLIVFPLLAGSLLVDERFHLALLVLTIPATLVAVFLGCRRHRDRRVALFAGAGLFLLLIAAAAGHDLAGEAGERSLTLAGGAILAVGHIRNLRLSRREATG